MSLLGREVWYVGPILYRGKVIRHDGGTVTLNCGIHYPEQVHCHESQVTTDVDKAAKQAAEMAEYWARKEAYLLSLADAPGC